MSNRSRFVWISLIFILTGCQIFPQPWTDVKAGLWWQDAVFYQIFVRSFYDSNNDGIGDFKGIIAKLDYLNDGKPETNTDLGVNAIWLMPINPSPSYHGYDVTDYYDVNPQYGSMEDFKTLLAEAHKRGIKVIIDFVINHTSSQHPWFKAANDGDPQYRDWYIWSESNPGYRGPWGDEAWHLGKNGYYYGVFVASMPDLNYRNPAVVDEIKKITAFWLKEVGVDGFRVDGAKHLIEEDRNQENTASTRAYFKEFTAYVHELAPEAVVVGEIWSGLDEIAPYVNNGELDLAFNFPLADNLVKSASQGNNFQALTGLENSQRVFQPGKYYAPFLTNHDMPRVMTILMDDPIKAKSAASLLLTAPGVPFIYYGEEIGMVGPKPDEKIRRPMQWTAEKNAGFTPDLPWMLVNEDYPQKNVETLAKDPDSLLNHYRALIAVRNNHYGVRQGQVVTVNSLNNSVFAVLRTAEKESVLVVINLSSQPVTELQLSWSRSSLKGNFAPKVLMGPQGAKVNRIQVDENGGIKEYQPLAELPAGQTLILQLVP